MFAQNPEYVAYEVMLKRLHRLVAKGKEDSQEAEDVREAMVTPFRNLRREEKERLNHLSADLYQLQDDEVYEPVANPALRTEAFMKNALTEASANKNWEELLSLLRKGPDYLASHQLAFLRAVAYANLGHTDTALLFMQYASEKEPQNAFYKAEVLRLLCDLDRTEEAVAQAYGYIHDEHSLPNALILAASVLYSFTEGQAVEEARPIYIQVVAALERALAGVQASDMLPSELIGDAYVILGYAHDALGQYAHARAAYVNALNWDSGDTAAKEALNLLDQGSTEAIRSMRWREPPSESIGRLPQIHTRINRREYVPARAA